MANLQKTKRIYQHLYFWVLVSIALGIAMGIVFPAQAAELKWLADAFINLVKMVIAPTIFCTIVVGIAGLGNLAQAGGLALRTITYFLAMTLLALIIGLVVINAAAPGVGLNMNPSATDLKIGADAQQKAANIDGFAGFILHLIPESFVGAFTSGQLIQVLVLAILVAIAIGLLGERGTKALAALDTIAQIMFGVIKIVMYAAPIGAFGGMAYTIGTNGAKVLSSLAFFMGTFYLTCAVFILLVLGIAARLAGFNIFKFIRFIKSELLIVLGTSSSEAVLPRMLVKLEAAGVQKSVVGLTIPTGYSFNLDGTCIYLTMGALFVAQATGAELSIWTQVGLLLFMLLSSKGAAGVTGAGLVTLAASLVAFAEVIPQASVGIALIAGIDRFMSEARAITNVIGNGVGTLVIACWQNAVDRDKLTEVLDNPQQIDVDELMRGERAVTEILPK